MKYYAIIVAGGSGKRMDNIIPKQFLLLNGQPLLFHTLSAFFNSPEQPDIILVINKDQQDAWKSLCTQYALQIPHIIVDGGQERFFSVKNALNTIQANGIVAIHDAVRPLVSPALISKIFKEASEKGNAVAAVSPVESIRYRGRPINRAEVVLIQTPQAFESQLIKEAYLQPYHSDFTDDATVAEAYGVPINLVEGERKNIKITWPEDLVLAEHYLKGLDVDI